MIAVEAGNTVERKFHDVYESVFVEFGISPDELYAYATTSIAEDDDDEDYDARCDVSIFLKVSSDGDKDANQFFSNAIDNHIERFDKKFAAYEKATPAELLASQMKMKKLKQGDFIHIMPQSSVSNILNGKREITLEQAKGLTKFLGVPISLWF
jgi:HTH-type transcriptional regulator/antitoxin HigA